MARRLAIIRMMAYTVKPFAQMSHSRKRKIRTSSIANALTRAVVRGKKIETFEKADGKVDIWISGEYTGWLHKDLAEDILGRE